MAEVLPRVSTAPRQGCSIVFRLKSINCSRVLVLSHTAYFFRAFRWVRSKSWML